MARTPAASRIIFFNYNNYLKAVDKEMKRAVTEVSVLLWKTAQRNAGRLPFKTNEVRLAGGGVTSDAMRRDALIQSIVRQRIRWAKRQVLEGGVSALMSNFEDSHIGIYYEYGTGEFAITPPVPIPTGTPNKFRLGRAIVSRSRHIDYVGEGRGIWYDAGGNRRITGSGEAGVRNAVFISKVGEDLVAERWFARAVEEVRPQAKEIFLEAMDRVNPVNFLSVRPTFTLGKG